MLALFWVLLLLFALAGLSGRYGADSRRGLAAQQLEWSVRSF